MEILGLSITGLYLLILVPLAIFGLHRYQLIFLWFRNRKNLAAAPPQPDCWPVVTIQLPMYNERFVASRILQAMAAVDYPRDRFEVQVLDDSTDETREVVVAAARQLQRAGVQVEIIRRRNRHGYKAGALENGLEYAKGEFIAIFDADFLPQGDFLKRALPHFQNPDVGMVQARWGHLNRNHSILTQVQAIFLDGHFCLEHGARFQSGRFFNFNGTAGIWRRTAIEDAGGWQHDTLTEDLDLSYRCQLKGWRFVFLPNVEVPAELPIDVAAFKSQQHRWTKGSVETMKKLLMPILRSSLSWKIKLEACFHLLNNFAYLLMVLLSLILAPTLYLRRLYGWENIFYFDLPVFLLASMSVTTFYLVAQRQLSTKWWKKLLYIPSLMGIGMGISINNARAVIEALWGYRSAFLRTPKYWTSSKKSAAKSSDYRLKLPFVTWLEMAMAVYFVGQVWFALKVQYYLSLPFLVLFAWGFSYIAVSTLWQCRGAGRPKWLGLRLRRLASPKAEHTPAP